MYLLYVDESGDPGIINSPTQYFLLSGIVFHELRWNSIIDGLVDLRKFFKAQYGLKLNEEVHASNFINDPMKVLRIPRHIRLQILKQSIHWLSLQQDINIITVRIDKTNRANDVFNFAWEKLFQRFENTIHRKNFPGPSNTEDKGFIISDKTDEKKLVSLLRKMRRYNAVPNVRNVYGEGYRNLKLNYIIEDPFFKDSKKSYIHQMVDVVAYFAHQKYKPNKYIKKKGCRNYYDILDPVLCKVASKSNPLGIVEY